jgi:hypothetical protein
VGNCLCRAAFCQEITLLGYFDNYLHAVIFQERGSNLKMPSEVSHDPNDSFAPNVSGYVKVYSEILMTAFSKM